MTGRRFQTLILFVAMLGWSALAHAQAVQDPAARFVGTPIVAVEVRIEGRPDTTPALLALVDIQPGDRLAPEAWRRVADRFDQIPRFEGVTVRLEERIGGVALIFDLEPRHPIDALRFAGDTGVSEADLDHQVRARFNGLPAVARLVEVEDETRRILKDEGYRSASVAASVEKRHDPDRSTLVLTVAAGPRTVIESVDLRLNAALDPVRTRARLGVEDGAPLRERALAAALASIRDDLRAKQFFSAVALYLPPTLSADGTRAHLVITIDAGPIIDVVVNPANALPGNADDLIQIKRQGSVETDLLEESQKRILDALHAKGYRNATASFDKKPMGDRLVITFTVSRGKRYKIAGVDVPAGAHMGVQEYEAKPALKKDAWFDPAAVRTALDAIRALYQKQGYYQVKMTPEFPEVAGKDPKYGWVTIRPGIVEGPRGFVAGITFTLGERPIVTEDDLRRQLTLKTGDPFDLAKFINDKDALSDYYLSRGFLTHLVNITPVFNADRTQVTLSILANEGLQIFVGEIIVVGNEHIKTDTIVRALTFQVGSPYSNRARIDSQRALYNALSFRNVHITADERLPGETTTRVVVAVEESTSRSFDFGPGLEAGTQPTPNGGPDKIYFAPRAFISAGRRNLGGHNRSINGYARVSFKPRPEEVVDGGRTFAFTEYRITGTYHDLYAFRSSTDALLSVTSEQGIRTSYNFARRIAALDLSRPVTPRVTLLGRYSLEWTRRFDDVIPENEQPLVDRLFPQVRLSIFSGAVVWDRRDNRIAPKRGGQITSNFDVSFRKLGSEVGFVKSFAEGSYFVPLADRLTLALRSQLGVARGFERVALDPTGHPILDELGNLQLLTDLPASQRFFSGGSSSVRGFQLDRLGDNDPIRGIMTEDGLSTGGNALIVFNAELRARAGQIFRRDLTVVGFVDSGNVFRRVSYVDLAKLRTTLGFGVRYDSPFGPLRLDFGFKTDQQFFAKAIERRWEFHLSFGEVF